MNKSKVKDYNPFDWPDEFRNSISKGPIVLFLGSGISMDSPSCLPNGNHLKNDIFETILSNEKLSESLIKETRDVVSIYRLEVFLYLIDEWAGIEWRYLLDFMLDAQPNLNHYGVAHLVRENWVKHVVTTNFDCLIEDAFKEYDIPINLKYSNADFEHWSPNGCVPGIFKLHGSLVDASGNSTRETIIGSITQVANQLAPGLSQHKASFLRYIMENFIVIFLGYSGRDEFDIYPMIYNSDVKQIIWVSHSSAEKPPEFEFYNEAIEREHPDPIYHLMLKHKNTIRAHCHSSSFISDLSEFLTGHHVKIEDRFIQEELRRPEPVRSLKSPYSFIGHLLRSGNRWKSAAEAIDLALGDRAIGDNYYLAELYRNRGICAKELGSLSEAYKHLEKAFNLCESEYSDWGEDSTEPFIHQRHFIMMSQICEDIGLIYFQDKDFDNALNWIKQAISWSKRIIRPNNRTIRPKQYAFLARNFGNLGLIYLERGIKYESIQDLENANIYFESAVMGEASVGNIVGLVRSTNNWAYFSMITSQWRDALNKSTQCLILMKTLHGSFPKNEIMNTSAMVVCSLCALASNRDEAEGLLQECMQLERVKELIEKCVKLYEIAERQGFVFARKPEEQVKYIPMIFGLVSMTFDGNI